MKVIDEEFLRASKLTKGSEFCISEDTILTPMAKDYVYRMKIKLKTVENSKTQYIMSVENNFDNGNIRYIDYVNGTVYKKKPENMTHINSNKLVKKNHPRIKFRGKIDSLEAKIMEVEIIAEKNNLPNLICDLQEILDFVREILAAEVKETVFSINTLLGYTFEELRNVSHNPRENFGIDHPIPSYKMGEIAVAINTLRTLVRETELLSIEAFQGKHNNIVEALNRLSSAIYILLLKLLSEKY